MRLAALLEKYPVMNSTAVISIVRDALELTLIISAPLLLTALAAGLVVSVFQAATQINEMTLSFIPKLIAVFVAAVVAGPWMLQLMIDYTQRLFTSIPGMVG
jgi:flagellar biosynthetic protein FliQ